MKLTIHYHHTDCGGVVYYGNYMQFFEEARTDYLKQRGYSVKELMKQGHWFVVYRQEVDYKAPLFYGDEIDIETRITELSDIRIVFEYVIRNQEGRLTTKGRTVMISINDKLHPQPLPQEMRAALAPAAV